jgi:predicted dehydrogenase
MGKRNGAIVGFGFIAEKGHVPAYRARADLDIVAVADPCAARRDAARRTLPGARVYPDLPTLLRCERSTLDFVDVSAPPHVHCEVARSALEAGLDVLCEKPMATSAAEARSMIADAKRFGRVLFPSHNYKHAPVICAVRRALDSGAIGAVHQVTLQTFRSTHARGVAEWNPGWRRERRYAGGGIAMDHGSHTFYLAFEWLRAHPTAITACTSTRDGADTEDTMTATVTFPTGMAHAHLTWTAGVRRVIYTLHGDRGAIRVEDDAVEVSTMDAPHTPHETTWTRNEVAVSSAWMDASHVGWFASMLGDFSGAMESRLIAGPEATDALRCVELIEAAYASAADGARRIELGTAS